MADQGPLTLSIGEILWDIFPDGRVMGGAPANVAWHASQFGADARIISSVGRDKLGSEILENLARMGLDVSTVERHATAPTGTVVVSLDDQGNAAYEIVQGVAWDEIPATQQALALAARADAINFGTLAQRSVNGQQLIQTLLHHARQDSIRLFDINLRDPYVDAEVIKSGLVMANAVKMNEDELDRLERIIDLAPGLEPASNALFSRFANLNHIIVTRGKDGLWWNDGRQVVSTKPTGPIHVADTVGAGDSVTATVLVGLAKGFSVPEIARAAMAVASFVCGCKGGTPELPQHLSEQFRR